jgi:Zn-finger nucleic acid-binding protein
MFFGSKFCEHCGADAVSVDVSETEDLGNCPRCSVALDHLQIDKISLRECKHCGGVWSGAETFEKICVDRDEQSAALTFFGSRPQTVQSNIPIRYVPCPQCKQLMNRSNFARSSGVTLDLCKAHGVWFDAGELPRIVEFIEKGGLARAREKEKIALDDEREKIRDERRQLELSEMRSGTYPDRASSFAIDGSRLLKALFDL